MSVATGDSVAPCGSGGLRALCAAVITHVFVSIECKQPLTSGYESLAKTWRRAVLPHCVSPTTTILQRSNPLLSIAPRVSLSGSVSTCHLAPRGSRVAGRGAGLAVVVVVVFLQKRQDEKKKKFSCTVWCSFGYMLCALCDLLLHR